VARVVHLFGSTIVTAIPVLSKILGSGALEVSARKVGENHFQSRVIAEEVGLKPTRQSILAGSAFQFRVRQYITRTLKGTVVGNILP
jgi:hypothetical protein